MPKKKVLFVTNTMGQAGAETAMMNLMRALLDTCEIAVFSLIPQGEMYGRLPDGVRVLNARCSAKSVMNGRGTLAVIGTLARCFFRRGAGFRWLKEIAGPFARQLRAGELRPKQLLYPLLAGGAPRLSEAFDLAIANIEGAAAYYVASEVRAKKKVAFIHIDYGQARYSAELDRGCYDAFDAIFPISDSVRTSFLREYPQLENKTHVFDNLFDRERIRTLAQEDDGIADDCPNVLFTAARLHPQKAVDVSIRAAALLQGRGVDFVWYVAGEGAERPALERLIRSLHLEDRFKLVGFMKNPYPLLRRAALYVHVTRYEGKSIAIEEAKMLHKPIIASDIPGNREQITSGQNGLLVPIEPSAVADAIESLLADPEMQRKFGEASDIEDAAQSRGMDKLREILEG